MTAQTATSFALEDDGTSPVEMLVVGCPLALADGFANALRNQGQAAHIKLAETLDTLAQQLASNRCHVGVVNADSEATDCAEAIARIRENNPAASLILIASDPAAHRRTAIDHNVQDLVPIEHADHVALAVKREHQTQLLRSDVKRLQRQLDEAEERSNQLVQSSRDAIAYIHEGMYLNTNQAYLDMFGYQEAEDLEGLPIMDMIDAESRRLMKFR